MARGTTLGQLLTMLRVEANLDPNPALSLNVDPRMRLRLRAEQERLYDDFAWPFMRIRVDRPTSAGERYYDVPPGMNLERIERVDVFWGTAWQPAERGITSDNYSFYNSDLGIRADPVLRWDIHDTGDGPQVELWPIPTVDGNLVRFTGIKALPDLLEDTDRAALDDQVLAMLVAAEFIKDKNASGEKRQKALTRLHTLRGLSTHTRANSFVLGGASPSDRPAYRPPLVAYVRNQ